MITRLLLVTLISLTLGDLVKIRNKNYRGNYQISLKNYQDASKLLSSVDGLADKCNNRPTVDGKLLCPNLDQRQLSKLLEQSDIISQLTGEDSVTLQTVEPSKGRKRRSVPWNLDRLNDIGLNGDTPTLDGSYKDEAEVDLYIVGSGVMLDHSEFESRATQPFNAFSDHHDDCDGSGTKLASLAAGRSMGIARLANIKSVKVMHCDHDVEPSTIIEGLQFVKDSIRNSSNRAVVLIGFNLPNKNNVLDGEIVDLSQSALVLAGAGDIHSGETDFDACHATPSSAKGSSALNGVMTVGSTNEDDAVISKIGPCVDLFAPGYNIPAAGTADSVDREECTGSLCAAALAAGVIAQTLRSNSKITVEVQKSMLINGATQRKDLSLNFKEGSDYEDLNLEQQTKWRLLYYACGYYKDPGTPECTSHASWCDNVAISTFDGNSVPIYQQDYDKCKFVVFEADSGEKVIGSYSDCSLATYTITIPNGGGEVELKPGPYIHLNGDEVLTPQMLAEVEDAFHTEGPGYKIHYEDDLKLTVAQPTVVVQLGTSVRMVYDCTSKLTIELLDRAVYNGKTGGLCGLYDNDGTNDYRLPDESTLSRYERSFHQEWMSPPLEKCMGGSEECDDSECNINAEIYCDKLIDAASDSCMEGKSRYGEKQACIREVSQCCCDAKKRGNNNPDLKSVCCKESYPGNFERGRKECSMCDHYECVEPEANEFCYITNGQDPGSLHEYLSILEHLPVDCCHYVVEKDAYKQTCVSPRNRELNWDITEPHCSIKKCDRPVVNEKTILSPDKPEYDCGDTLTITCVECWDKHTPKQIVKCESEESSTFENDAKWNAKIENCEEIKCQDPTAPYVDNRAGVPTSVDLSWVVSPYSRKCHDKVQYECDICYDLQGEEAVCTPQGYWDPGSICRLRYCQITEPNKDKYPLTITGVSGNVRRACNRTIDYVCQPNPGDTAGSECYKMNGKGQRQCRVDDDNSIGWDRSEPECELLTCKPGQSALVWSTPGYYSTWLEDEYKRIWITGSMQESTEINCGSPIKSDCEDCFYLTGAAERICQPDGTFNGEAPKCNKKTCPPPDNDPTVTHAKFVNRITYECGSEVTFECKKCHEHKSGDATHTCTSSPLDPEDPKDSRAAWEGEDYICQRKECPALTAPEHGWKLDGTDSTLCGDSVAFECEPCYEIDGDNSITCQDDKTWSGEVPTCKLKECPSIWGPQNGTISEHLETCGAEAIFDCDTCFYMEGEPTTECLNDKHWSNLTPQCIRYSCLAPGYPAHGHIINSIPYYLCGETLEYACQDRCYDINWATNECKPGVNGGMGVWENETPTCTRRTCPRPLIPNSDTAIVPDKDEFQCGETFYLDCPDCCYEKTEDFQFTCTPDGWDKQIEIGCKKKKCPEATDLEIRALVKNFAHLDTVADIELELEDGSSAIYSKQNECHEKIRYSCKECYFMRGEPVVECQHNQTWSQKPVCELKTCEIPEAVTTHLSYTVQKTKYSCHETIAYECKDICWDLVGNNTLTCTDIMGSESFTADWDFEAPHCEIRTCPTPEFEESANGPLEIINPPKQHLCGSEIEYNCPLCFKLEGTSIAKCTSDHTWSSAPPVCVPDCCPPIDIPLTNDPTYSKPVFQFNYKVPPTDYQNAQCEGKRFECQMASIECEECHEYVEEGVSYTRAPTRVCSGGSWTNEDKTCTRRVCETRIPADNQYIHYVETDMQNKTNCGDTVEFECERCYETPQLLHHKCEPSKQWNGDIPTCTKSTCTVEPKSIGHCEYTNNNNDCGEKRTLECEDCWYIDGCHERTAECTPDKTWQWLGVGEPVRAELKTCDRPPYIEHATSTADNVDEFGCGSMVKYWCDDCYKFTVEKDCACSELKCQGTSDAECGKGSWVVEGGYDMPVCELKTCPSLGQPANGTANFNHNIMEWGCGSSVSYTCDEGYVMVSGDAERNCTSGETWTGAEAVCQIKNCTQLDAPKHGDIDTQDRHYGTIVEFTCHECYEFPPEQVDPNTLTVNSTYPRYHILNCESSGNWNGSEPYCKKRECDRPVSPQNGMLVWEAGFGCGDVVTYECDTGYYLSNDDTSRTCQPDGSWSGEDPTCTVKKCHDLEDVPDGSFDKREEYTVTETVEIECDTCYQISAGKDRETMHCEDTEPDNFKSTMKFGEWMPTEMPVCEAIMCSVPPKPAHGAWESSRDDLAENFCLQRLTLNCEEGYRVSDREIATVQCQESGQWNPTSFPTCVKVCCGTPEPVRGGEWEALSDNYCYGAKVKFTCNHCYDMDEDHASQTHYTCEVDSQGKGVWSHGFDTPACSPVTCNWITAKNTHFTIEKDGLVRMGCGESRLYTCREGYAESGGQEMISCGKNGEWDGTPLVCKEEGCDGTILDIDHGTYQPMTEDWEYLETGEAVYPSDTYVEYECKKGYKKTHKNGLVCKSGEWTPSPPRCVVDECPAAPGIGHGKVTKTGTTHGDTATYSCNKCYQLNTLVNTLTCDDGRWISVDGVDEKRCEEITCISPSFPAAFRDDTFDFEKAEYSCGDVVDYECKEGYTRHGNSQLTCGEDGRWSSEAPICAKTDCEALNKPENGGISFDEVDGQDVATFTCDTGYRLTGGSDQDDVIYSKSMTCEKGQWTGTEPECALEICGDPGDPEFSTRTVRDTYTDHPFSFSSTVTYICDNGYQVLGKTVLTCQANGLWDHKPPKCICSECSPLAPIAHGRLDYPLKHTYDSRVQYICDKGYEMAPGSGNIIRRCQENGMWSGEAPTCERVECASAMVPVGATPIEMPGSSSGRKFNDTIKVECPVVKQTWVQTCSWDGSWKVGNAPTPLPSDCSMCREVEEVRQVEETIHIKENCYGGGCDASREEVRMVAKTFTVIDCSTSS